MLCGVYGRSRFLFYGKDRLHKVDETLFPFYRCLCCGLVSLSPQPSQEELKRYYPKEYGPYRDRSQVIRYGALPLALKRLCRFSAKKPHEPVTDSRDGRLLDFGCGSGAYLEQMKLLHPHWELHGFDTSEFACEQTHAKGFHVHTGDLKTDSFPEKYFDIIHLGHVIEHLPDPKATLSLLRPWLKRDSMLVLSTPNVSSLAARLFRKYWFALDAPRHLFLFSPETITQLLADTDFAVTSITCTKDMGVEVRSVNYLFNRSDMRIPFVLWHAARALLAPMGIVLAFFKKTSIMSVRARKT
ncbi:MAG: Methylase involved in ubiquinone/menaquinone biosynthesis [Parcubacteria group bacterium GW2011_GWA2_49_16]|uniref:Methylase involved in ubiquinone/menaquinone biosynthesis n=1 Tax=Candidatus Adlerbacteria bacterium GW2011_GWC1_50_9 TaxID=1618608 RepID=A0A0G1WRH7_9BACT|nr:MAG: Methylase involved in ubiquinone/menaquinone biosynthesis [Parcubacteria group bacterium GW2011_GWA2_49_16]KKW21463.1 MAG: Methylase involved in ubiquinone/menaquinone biosynthesis [Candidatus Adlerbacteria bacterium GW2011_GWC1_50_9]